MTDLPPRCFPSDAAVVRVGEGLLARTLPRHEWTHEAHLAATVYLLQRRPDIDVDRDLPSIIRRYNESIGGVNSDSEGYHETITRLFLRAVRLFLKSSPTSQSLTRTVNALLHSPMGKRDWPLRFYSPERLFSPQARRSWVEPDIELLP